MKKNVLKHRLFSVVMAVFMVASISACSKSDNDPAAPSKNFGVVALNNVGSIGILSGDLTTASTQTLTTVYLKGELGSFGGGLFDVVISPDGKTTAVTNFGDSTMHFIDTTVPTAPVSGATVSIGFFAEDMAMTPDGKFILVTDGGFSQKIAVVSVATKSLISTYETPTTAGPQFQSVAVAADGKTVLAADYWDEMVHVLTIDASGTITYVSSIDVSDPTWDYVGSDYVRLYRPVNISISPDGKTAIASCVGSQWQDVAGTIPAENMAFPVMSITAPGVVELTDMATVPHTAVTACQSLVFNRSGNKAYAMCTQPYPDPDPALIDPTYPGPKNVIQVLNVTNQGKAVDSGTRIEVEIYGRSQLFGVDTLAFDNPGRYLYVSNPTVSGGSHFIQVIDTDTNLVVKTFNFDPIDTAVSPDPPSLDDPIPTGIYFWHN